MDIVYITKLCGWFIIIFAKQYKIKEFANFLFMEFHNLMHWLMLLIFNGTQYLSGLHFIKLVMHHHFDVGVVNGTRLKRFLFSFTRFNWFCFSLLYSFETVCIHCTASFALHFLCSMPPSSTITRYIIVRQKSIDPRHFFRRCLSFGFSFRKFKL